MDPVTRVPPAIGKISSFDRDDMSLKARRAREVAETRTSRGRRSAATAKRATGRRVTNAEPTPERLAKGDLTLRTAGGFHRSVSPVERLRDQGKLDHQPHINQGMFEAAEKLRRHYSGCMTLGGVQAQDLTREIGGAGVGPEGEESWVHNFDIVRRACKLMGWSGTCPHRGAGRLVFAVVCEEMTVYDAALMHIGSGRAEAVKAAGMDRLREGLFALATFWRLI